MAVEIVRTIAFHVVRCSIGPVWSELGYIIFYRSNIDNLNVQLQNLEAARQTLQQRVDAAEQNGEKIFVNVQDCLMKVVITITKANDFRENEGHARVGCLNANLWTMHQQSKKATEMAKEISEMVTQVNEAIKMDKISSLPRLPVALTPSARGYEALHSRTSILNEIMLDLKEDNMHMIGVYGMGSVGKSTLIKEVAWQAEHGGYFDAVIVAIVTRSSDVKGIQGQLADGLGLKFNEESKEGRARRLHDRIRKENKILVIMDDIWGKIDLMEVGVPFGDEDKGCKLLLTSRNLNVLNSEMSTQKNYRLEILSEEESWNLFEKIGGDVVKDKRIQSTAFEVAGACKGLPLLLVTVAKALKNQDLYAWKDAFIQLTKHDHEGLSSVANEAIELSYKYLGSDQHRFLFLLIASDGKSAYIEDLLVYAWGLGLFKNVEWLTDARNKLYKLIDDLKASSLLLEGKREWLNMHDVIRDGASKIASRVQPFFRIQWHHELKEWPEMNQLRPCKLIMLPWCYISVLPESLDCPELALLVLCSQDNYLKVPDHFFSGMRDLKVLDLGGMVCTPSLPPSLHLLKNLTALYLCGCILEDIVIVSKLTCLEILSLENSEIQELPEEIGQLTHLRLLNLSNCIGLKLIPANLISRLTALEELYVCYIQWEIKGSKLCNNASLGELRHLHRLKSLHLQIQDISNMPKDLLIFGKLETYKILMGDGWKWSWGYFGYSETSRTLKLNMSSTTVNHLDRGIKMLLNGVEDLSLAEVKGAGNVFPGLNGDGMAHLRHLLIQNSVEILYIIDLIEWVHPHLPFPNLESLVIRNLINLEKICCGQLSVHIFTKLQVIKVKGCDRLKNLFSFSIARNLPHLLEIDISECKLLANVIDEQLQEEFEDNLQITFPTIHSIMLKSLPNLISFASKQWSPNTQFGSNITNDRENLSNAPTLFDEKVAMPNLETMMFSSINMARLWDDVSTPSCIQNLTNLTVDSCGGLKYLFPSSVVMSLIKLQYLKITNCQMMEDIFVLDGKLGNLQSAMKPLTCEEVKFLNLETLLVSHMDNLKSVYPVELASNPFPKLNKMEISFCQKLLNVFPSYLLNSLHNMEILVVTDCAALEVIFETPELNNEITHRGKLATQLKTLSLERLPILRYIWSNDPRGSLQFQNLCFMNASNCQSLSHIFPLSVAMELRQLQVLRLEKCGVESIVAKGEMVEEDPRFVFPQLTSLTFWYLEKLKSFYPGMNTLSCSSLQKLDVFHCYELEMFKSKPKSQNIQEVSFHGHPIFSSVKVIPKIQELSLSSNDVTSICNGEYCDDDLYLVKALCLQCFHDELDKLPMSFLQRFTNLEKLEVACSSFKGILSNETVGTIMTLKTLTLSGLHYLEYLCRENSEIQPIVQKLESLEVYWCSKLKNVVPSSSLELFQNLDMLKVGNCSGLVNIITSSAGSLLKLRELIIYNCEMVDEIVASDDNSDGGEITFMKLKCLSLIDLPRLTSFCKEKLSFKFPLLRELCVRECPKMETFSHGILSTPMLRKVQVTEYVDGEWRWEGELNTTIRKIFDEMIT